MNNYHDAIKTYKRILQQVGKLVVDVSGLIEIGNVLKEKVSQEDWERLMK